jgi:regulator of ribonuclease activity A
MCFGHTDSPEEKHMSTAEPSATADLYDEHGENLQSCDLQMRQYGATRRFGGTITTVRCFEDNALVKSILGEDGVGRVLVVDGGGSIHTALIGDIIAKIAITNRWAGVVINGAVRDVAVLAELPIGCIAILRSRGSWTGTLHHPHLHPSARRRGPRSIRPWPPSFTPP